MIAIPKPVFSDYTVFWAVFALKTRKLPDLPQTVRRGRVFAPKVHQRAALSFVLTLRVTPQSTDHARKAGDTVKDNWKKELI